MKRFTLLKKMLLLCALIVGSVNGWAGNNVSTVSTSFSANGNVTSNFTQTGDYKSAAWDLSVTWADKASWQALNATKGSQIGSGGKQATQIVLTGTSISGTITSVVVNSSVASGGTTTVAVSVGGTAFSCSGNATATLATAAADYTFTGSASGDVVITWSQPSTTKAIYIKSITTTYSSGAATTTTIDATGITNTDVYTSTTAGTLTASVKKKSDSSVIDGATVTWSSSDDDIATIGASTGVVTLVSAGSVTFTATYAGNATYAGSNATYNMTVTTSAPVSVCYKVTDASTLKVGDQLVIVNEDNNVAMGGLDGSVHDDVAVTITSSSIEIPDGVAILTLGGETGAWTLKSSLSKNYLNMTGYSNELKENSTADADGQKWSISISGGEAMIINKAYPSKASNDDTDRYIMYNTGSGGRFACYAGTVNAVSIYRISKQVTITNAKYATYCGDVILNYSGVGIKAFIAKDNGSTIGLTEIANGQVPTSTPVILYKAGADGTAINVPVIASTTTVIDDDDNDLEVSDGTTAKGDDIYVLAKNPTVGFYKWKSASSLSEGKIYLKASTPVLAREFIGFDDETTGINAVENGNSDVKDAVIYNLNGQRVVNPSKGLYIVNGKKVIIK